MNAEQRKELARLWQRMDSFCTDRGWTISLYVREDDPTQFGRVGAVVEQPGGYFIRVWGDTTREVLAVMVRSLERDGFA